MLPQVSSNACISRPISSGSRNSTSSEDSPNSHPLCSSSHVDSRPGQHRLTRLSLDTQGGIQSYALHDIASSSGEDSSSGDETDSDQEIVADSKRSGINAGRAHAEHSRPVPCMEMPQSHLETNSHIRQEQLPTDNPSSLPTHNASSPPTQSNKTDSASSWSSIPSQDRRSADQVQCDDDWSDCLGPCSRSEVESFLLLPSAVAHTLSASTAPLNQSLATLNPYQRQATTSPPAPTASSHPRRHSMTADSPPAKPQQQRLSNPIPLLHRFNHPIIPALSIPPHVNHCLDTAAPHSSETHLQHSSSGSHSCSNPTPALPGCDVMRGLRSSQTRSCDAQEGSSQCEASPAFLPAADLEPTAPQPAISPHSSTGLIRRRAFPQKLNGSSQPSPNSPTCKEHPNGCDCPSNHTLPAAIRCRIPHASHPNTSHLTVVCGSPQLSSSRSYASSSGSSSHAISMSHTSAHCSTAVNSSLAKSRPTATTITTTPASCSILTSSVLQRDNNHITSSREGLTRVSTQAASSQESCPKGSSSQSALLKEDVNHMRSSRDSCSHRKDQSSSLHGNFTTNSSQQGSLRETFLRGSGLSAGLRESSFNKHISRTSSAGLKDSFTRDSSWSASLRNGTSSAANRRSSLSDGFVKAGGPPVNLRGSYSGGQPTNLRESSNGSQLAMLRQAYGDGQPASPRGSYNGGQQSLSRSSCKKGSVQPVGWNDSCLVGSSQPSILRSSYNGSSIQ